MPVLIERREFAKSVIDRAVRRALKATGGGHRRAFARLLCDVRGRSDMLRPGRFVGRVAAEPFDRLLRGLAALAARHREWLRPAHEWEPAGANPWPLFSSLAHHLLANYPVPPVLEQVWFEPGEGRGPQNWYIRVGQGLSLRESGLPLTMSRRMAHEFAHAPAQFPVNFALRWAQVRALGGSDALALAVAASQLSEWVYHEEFWAPVIVFFVNHPDLDPARVGDVVTYLHHQKFVYRTVIIGDDTEVSIAPAQPELSLKGWTTASLLRRVAAWEAARAEPPARRLIRWPRSAFGGYRRDGVGGRVWTVVELLDSDALAAEGKAMSHCVATYTDWCSKRCTTIWSLGTDGEGGRTRVVTVEVDPDSRTIVQVKGPDNTEPDDETRTVLDDWARQEELKADF